MDSLEQIKVQFDQEIIDGDLEVVRINYLGRKGIIAEQFKKIREIEASQKNQFGKELNQLKLYIQESLDNYAIQKHQSDLNIDILPINNHTLAQQRGHLSLITQTILHIQSLFEKMGFSVATGPEIETEWYNFDALNIDADHPARDMWDTIWTKADDDYNKKLLRTHTSPVQIRYMEPHVPPYRIISPGIVYRFEATDATHETTFYQCEGLMVDKNTSIATFKGIMQVFFSEMFRLDISVRLRPSYFPFVEPGFEMDITCVFCATKEERCGICKKTGWIEIGGAGMVHKKVLNNAGVKDTSLQGFAFGFGVERIVMLKYGISDIRLFRSGDLRVAYQF